MKPPKQLVIRLSNGYTLSCICGPRAYGDGVETFECAFFPGRDTSGALTYVPDFPAEYSDDPRESGVYPYVPIDVIFNYARRVRLAPGQIMPDALSQRQLSL